MPVPWSIWALQEGNSDKSGFLDVTHVTLIHPHAWAMGYFGSCLNTVTVESVEVKNGIPS